MGPQGVMKSAGQDTEGIGQKEGRAGIEYQGNVFTGSRGLGKGHSVTSSYYRLGSCLL